MKLEAKTIHQEASRIGVYFKKNNELNERIKNRVLY